MRKLVVLAALVGTFFVVPTAQAEIDSVFDGTIACTTQSGGAADGQRWCGTGQHNPNPSVRSTVESFDGVPIDVNVAFPDGDEHGDGPFPLVYMFHGYGGGKINFPSMNRWLSRGYAVLSQTNRGFHESCGTAGAKAADPDCETSGFVRLDDTRYEVRDAQLFAGMLVDEGRVIPDRIAATGGSYGGGMSMALAALKDRIMLPDSTYAPWESPDGTPMSLAVATPNIPWTDLAYSLVPNGSNIDYIKDASYYGRFGVMKQSYVNGLYLSGLLAPGYYTAPGVQPEADLAGWKAFMDAGEPYDGTPQAQQMLDEVTAHHSSYYIDHSQPPAPLLISSGFTDDLFPGNEATRYYNRTRAEFPDTPIALFFGSFGHMRGQNGSEVTGALNALENQWIEYYLSNQGSQPPSNVTTFTQVCPNEAPDGGPYVTGNWVEQSPGEIVVKGADAQTVAPDGGDRAVGSAFNPAPAGTACAAPSGAQEPGTANYETEPAPAGGYTVMGSPTVIAKITQAGSDSQLAARLVDVNPSGSEKILVNRALWRPANSGFQVFQLQPNGWHVAEGHRLRLELLPFDGGDLDPEAALANFGRPSNNQQPATIESLELRIPVQEDPGALGGMVTAPAPRVLPDRPGVELAPGNEAIGSQTIAAYVAENYPCPPGQTGPGGGDCTPDGSRVGQLNVIRATVKGRFLTARIACPAANDSCARAWIQFRGAPRRGQGRNVALVNRRVINVPAGRTATVAFRLSPRARQIFRHARKRQVIRNRGRRQVRVVTVPGRKHMRARVMVNAKQTRMIGVKRNGRVR